jgi:hypothetical protein
MNITGLRLKMMGCMLTFLLISVTPAQADNSIATEIQQLKARLSELENQQIELKKDATAAAAALPDFSYRPGFGMNIQPADKSWGFRASIETNFRLLFESGLAESGRETGGVMARRFRPSFNYCINNCLYEIEVALDLDGFGTGNAKNATNTATNSILHHGLLWVHLENLNPWLPTFLIGMDGNASISSYRQGSSLTGAQLEYDLLSRNTIVDGTWGNGFGLNWDNHSLSDIGIPGRISRVNVSYANIREGDDGLQSFREQRSVTAYINVEPFSELKNKWLQGMGAEFGAWFCPNESATSPQNPQSIACNRLRIQDQGNGGKQTLFDTGIATKNNPLPSGSTKGWGLTHFLMPGLKWTVGPYQLRAVGAFQRYDGDNPDWKGSEFLIGHDLYLWSPKGFFTGSPDTAGSILFGTHFERTDVSCSSLSECNNGGQFKRDRILLREWDLWYFLAPRMSVGATWWWYDASNIRAAASSSTSDIQSSNNVQRNLGCVGTDSAGKKGAGCNWLDFAITYRYQW